MSASIDPREFEILYDLMGELYRMLACSFTGPGDGVPISPSQKRAIGYLRRNPDSTLSELAFDLDMTLGSVSDMVERLVAAGLVERKTNPLDRRQVQLSLTDEALAKALAMRAQRAAEFAQVKESLSPEAWDGFVQGMSKWITEMGTSNPRRHAVHAKAGWE
jgi:DNA-binding MarR family transcriptional regulator